MGRLSLSAEARRRINREAHRRAQELAPPSLYREAFARERAKLAAQYRVMLAAGVPLDQVAGLTEDKKAAFIAAARKRLAEAV